MNMFRRCCEIDQSFLFLISLVEIGGEWTSWSSCSKSCGVGTQNRTKMSDGEIMREEQFCNLQYCPGIGVSCSGRYCHQFDGMADCINKVCICRVGRNWYQYDYSRYYNKYNCYPEVGNCIIRESPQFALAHVQSLKYGYTLRSCVANDNPHYEVHMIGIYGDSWSEYKIVIHPRGEVKKPLVLVLSSYHSTSWWIDTSVHIDSIIYGSTRDSASQPINLYDNSKCGASNIIKWESMGSAYGSDTGGGNTVKVILDIERRYGPVTSFSGVYTLYSPRIIKLEVGGNPLQKASPNGFKYNDIVQCESVTPKYSVVTSTRPTTTSSDKETKEEEGLSETESVVIIPVVSVLLVTGIVCLCICCVYKRKAKSTHYMSTSDRNSSHGVVGDQARSFPIYEISDRNSTSVFNTDFSNDLSFTQIIPPINSTTRPSSVMTTDEGLSYDDTRFQALDDLPPPYSSCVQETPQPKTESSSCMPTLDTTHSSSREHNSPEPPPSYSSYIQGTSQRLTNLPSQNDSAPVTESR
ncbi:uncharacterized protein LOC133173223 [Saccostrea echinata]|uniref:uncharacterized protein LOC133173223 n=1 Tax=Saccostrea echinata TaxID=191078 RepID=UPI002A80799C|nr:uncharacterized protein LOC133173223 [Saccostrea echinata]